MDTKHIRKGMHVRTLAPSTTTERHPVGTVGTVESRHDFDLWAVITKWTRPDGVEKTDRSFYFADEIEATTPNT